ncbi:MAG: hypothetical protein KJZ92_13980 [Rhodocyclaceae bacterium]|nr:hypothetical protein [Rhodocyclaceae bacterium]
MGSIIKKREIAYRCACGKRQTLVFHAVLGQLPPGGFACACGRIVDFREGRATTGKAKKQPSGIGAPAWA